MPPRKQDWSVGDVFVVPQLDGICSIGQVLDQMMKNVVSCAFYDIRVPCAEAVGTFDLDPDRAIAVLSVSREQLDFGRWRVIGNQPVAIPRESWPNEVCRGQQWIGAKIYDAAIAEDLLNAYNGLTAWDKWRDPYYLDKLLVNPDRKPRYLLFKNKRS